MDGFSVLSDVGLSVLFKVGFIVLGLRVGEEVASMPGVGTIGCMDSGPRVVGTKGGDVIELIGVVVEIGLKVGLEVAGSAIGGSRVVDVEGA